MSELLQSPVSNHTLPSAGKSSLDLPGLWSGLRVGVGIACDWLVRPTLAERALLTPLVCVGDRSGMSRMAPWRSRSDVNPSGLG